MAISDTGSPTVLRRSIASTVLTGLWAGIVLGTAMGLLASVWRTPVSFLFNVANEILLTFAFEHLSPLVAATAGLPFVFFGLHLLIGAIGGVLVGLATALVLAVMRRRRARHVFAWQCALLTVVPGFSYPLLWFLHGKFTGPTRTKGIVAVLLLALAIGGVSWLIAAMAGAAADRVRRRRETIARALRVGSLSYLAIVVVLLLIGAARNFDRNRRADDAVYPARDRYKVVLIGVDGASWTFIQPLIEQGLMPNLQRLVDGGVRGALRSSLPPIESPTIWTSVATGKRPVKHGIGGFVMRDPDARKLVPVTNDMREAAAFWEIVSNHGLETDVVSWYVSWPAQQVNGVFVSERLAFPDADNVVVPELWSEALRVHNQNYLEHRSEQLLRFTRHPYNPNYLELNANSPRYRRDEHLSILEFTHRKDTITFGVARDLLRRGQPDVFAVYFEGIDRTSHRFVIHELARRHRRIMHWLYPHLGEEELLAFRNVLRQYHVQIDRWIGDLLSLVDEETAVIIVSDHGFGIHKPWKVHLKLDPLLAFLGELSYTATPGRHDVDWTATRLYDSLRKTKRLSRISVNLRGREPAGMVAAEDAHGLLEQTRDTILGLQTQNGKPIFRSARIHHRAATASSPGDLWVELDESCVADTVVLGEKRLPVAEFTRTEWMPGNHRIDGVFIGYGGPFKQGANVYGASVLDIAPTLLKISGIPPSMDMDGRPLDRAFQRESRKRLVRGLVPAYERDPIEYRDTTSPSPADSLILLQLKALGYIK